MSQLTDWIGAAGTAIAAVGTVGAFATALHQIKNERDYRQHLQEREYRENHRSQATKISAWTGVPDRTPEPNGSTPIYLINGSAEPVYTVVASIVFIQGAAPNSIEEQLKVADRATRRPGCPTVPVTTLSILPPGKWRVQIVGTHWSGALSGRSGAEVAFTDKAGSHWIRRGLGALEELPEPPLEYFSKLNLRGPYDFVPPEAFN